MVSYYDGFIAKEIAKTSVKRGKTKKTGGKDGGLEKDREPHATYSTPPKSERIRRSRERQKQKEKQERAEEQGPRKVTVSMSAARRHTKWREKVIMEGRPTPSAWTFKGTIEEVETGHIVVSNEGGLTKEAFILEETTKILLIEQEVILEGQKPKTIEKKQEIGLVDLRKGMHVSIRYTIKGGNMVAKWIKVTGSRFPIRL
jgi:hypothetical protein